MVHGNFFLTERADLMNNGAYSLIVMVYRPVSLVMNFRILCILYASVQARVSHWR